MRSLGGLLPKKRAPIVSSNFTQPATSLAHFVDALTMYLNRTGCILNVSAQTNEQPPRNISVDYCNTRKATEGILGKDIWSWEFQASLPPFTLEHLDRKVFTSVRLKITDTINGKEVTFDVSDLEDLASKHTPPSKKKK